MYDFYTVLSAEICSDIINFDVFSIKIKRLLLLYYFHINEKSHKNNEEVLFLTHVLE